MINITFYGIDPYMLRGLSKDLTEKVANLCEVSKEDILFMSSDGLLCFNGVEQDDWYALIYVDMPHELEVFEKQFVELFKYHLDKAVLHFEVVFRYYHNHSHYVELNEDYPRYIDEKNQVYAENDEDGESFKEVYNHEDECDDPECKEHHHDESIYLGNAFEGFEEKLEEIKEKKIDMELIEISIKIIEKVLNKESNFLQSLKEECKFLDKFDKSKVSSLVGMYFRNYFLISAFLKEHNLKENQRNSIILGLTFINNSFKHVEKDEEMLNFLFNELSKLKFDVNDEFKQDLNNLISLKRSYEFKNIKRNSIDGFSIRYNLPVWLIKLTINQYGKEDGLLVLKTLSNMPTQYLSINFERKIESSKDLENFTKIDEDLYVYNLDKTVKKEKLVFDNTLYLTQKDYKNIFKDLNLYPHSNITYFGDSNDNVIIDFIKKFYREDDTFYFVTPKLESNYQVMDKIKKFKKRNFHFHELSASAIRTYSIEGEDLIMYSPKSSDFDLFRRNPEYGVYFDRNSFDDIQNNIKNEINELTKYIKKDGYLIYFVPTINKKETSFIKDYVLSLNEEFELIKEELYLPLKKEDSLFYYFIIRRK